MPAKTDAAATPKDLSLEIIHFFDAPRELVFKAWTDPSLLLQWMGPLPYPMVQMKQDFRVGGSWSAILRPVAGGVDLGQGGVYKEIAPPERLVFTFSWDGANGQPTNDTLVTILLDESNGRTRMTFSQTPFTSVEQREGHNGGWTGSFDRLEEALPSFG